MEQKPQQPVQPQQAPVQPKKSDEKVLKILFGIVVFVLFLVLLSVIQFLPSCKNQCKNAMTMFEVVIIPVLIAVSMIAAGVLYRKVKKLPEPVDKLDSYYDEVPPIAFIKILMASYAVSALVNAIVGGIFGAVLKGSCGDAAFMGCKDGLVVPYYVFIFPLTLVGTAFAGYKLSYLLFVPLAEVGTYPNGKKIMKRGTPKQVKWMAMAAAVLATLMVLVITIIYIKSM